MMIVDTIADALLAYAYFYPLFMSYLWMFGGLYYRYHWEAVGGLHYSNPPALTATPPVTVLIPCFNEQAHIEETIEHLLELNYPDFEIIALNDGSTDNTAAILDQLSLRIANLRVVHLAENRGKAMA